MKIMDPLIDFYNKRRKYRQISRSYKGKYAFIGIGNHSLNNLYPILDYLNVSLKYIVTRSQESADIINSSIPGIRALTDLDVVLNDEEVKGVFISASAESHVLLIKKCLIKEKYVFVEKPPCFTAEELERLILGQSDKMQVLTGLQKRYAPAYTLLKKKAKGVKHYIMTYGTGAYPDGDKVMELFIHPVDVLIWLFGEAEVKSIMKNPYTYLIHLLHKNGVIGTVELSVDYSWKRPVEKLKAITEKGIYYLNGTSELLFESKPSLIFNMPLEKVRNFVPQISILFDQNSFLPLLQHNTLYVNGFYDEINAFIRMCETGDGSVNRSPLNSLRPVYRILESIQ